MNTRTDLGALMRPNLTSPNRHIAGRFRMHFKMLMLVMCAAFVAALSAPDAALAQPDPFSAYEASQQPGVVQPGLGDLAPSTPLAKGTFTGGLGASYAYTRASNDLVDGGSATNSTLFMRLAPEVGYFIVDRLELSFSPGLLKRSLDRGKAGEASDSAWLFEAKARYHLPLTERFVVLAGLGLGGYVGGSSRTVTIQELKDDGEIVDRNLSESTDTSGFSLSGQVGAGYFFDPRIQIRVTFDLNWLIGSEKVSGVGRSLDTSTTHTGLGAALMYYF